MNVGHNYEIIYDRIHDWGVYYAIPGVILVGIFSAGMVGFLLFQLSWKKKGLSLLGFLLATIFGIGTWAGCITIDDLIRTDLPARTILLEMDRNGQCSIIEGPVLDLDAPARSFISFTVGEGPGAIRFDSFDGRPGLFGPQIREGMLARVTYCPLTIDGASSGQTIVRVERVTGERR